MTRYGPVLILLLLGFCAVCEGSAILKTVTEEDEVFRRQKRDFGVSAAIGTAIAAISAGASVASATAAYQSLNHSVKMKMDVENLTKWPMVNTFAENNGGYIYSNPPLVQPGKREAFVTHDNGAVATGTYGTTGWRIGSIGEVVVMWSVPFDHVLYSNWMGFGLLKERVLHSTSLLYNVMYNGRQTWFKRKEFHSNASRLIYCEATICVFGTMGNPKITQATIYVLPRNYADLSPNVKQVVDSESWAQAVSHLVRDSK